jgi:Uma2 family endonuclease
MSIAPASLRHRHPVHPLRFPEEEPESEKLGEAPRHLKLRLALWQLLEREHARRHTIGSDQFVYFNARDPLRCCAPDVYVKLGVQTDDAPTWKVWERGAPELAIEITSPSDAERWTWAEKVERYHELGVRELVRFDPDAPAGERLHVWDRLDNDLVERVVEGDRTPCLTLGLWWVPGRVGSYPAPRLAREREGAQLLPTPEERATELEAEIERGMLRPPAGR